MHTTGYGGFTNPATSDRRYTDEELTFMKALHHYKEVNQRPFPTWSEVLSVVKALGYRKVAAEVPIPVRKIHKHIVKTNNVFNKTAQRTTVAPSYEPVTSETKSVYKKVDKKRSARIGRKVKRTVKHG